MRIIFVRYREHTHFFKNLLLMSLVWATYESPIVCILLQNVFVLCNSLLLDNKSLVFHALKYLGGFPYKRVAHHLPLSSPVAVLLYGYNSYFKNCDGGERYRFEFLKLTSKHLEKLRLNAEYFSSPAA